MVMMMMMMMMRREWSGFVARYSPNRGKERRRVDATAVAATALVAEDNAVRVETGSYHADTHM